MGVVSIACLAFLEIGGWQRSELKSAAADTSISLLWAALPLRSKWLCLEAQLPSLRPVSLNRSSPSSVLAGGSVQRQVPQAEALRFARVSLLREEQCCSGTSVPQDFSSWGQVWELPGALRVIHQRSADKSPWFWPILWLQMRPTVSLAQIRPLQEGRQWLGRFLCFVRSPF